MPIFLVVGNIDGSEELTIQEALTPENAKLVAVPRLELKHKLKPMTVTGIYEVGSYNHHYWGEIGKASARQIEEERDEYKFRLDGLDK